MHSWNESFETLQRLRRSTTIAVGVVLLVLSGICYTFAQEPTQKTFHSAAEASHALFVAVKGGDEQGLVEILGGKKELVSSEDEVADKAEREQFAQKYQEMHRLVHEPDGTTVLYIGAENWPFPIPLMSKAGAWYFDSEAGMQEVVFRRVGDNEATAIETCHALVSASKQSDTATGDDPVIQYAKALVAGPATNEGSDNSAGDGAANMGESRNPFHGYYFRRLSRGGREMARLEMSTSLIPRNIGRRA